GRYDMKFRVVGPYTLSHPSSYYAAGNGGAYLARDAINAANADVDYNNFANIDAGTVNKVGCVFIMYAGTPQSSTGNTDEVWPHQSDVPNMTVDGVRFSHYVCGPEKSSQSAMGAIGVMCHEFGHALGLPDHYDTYNNSSDSTTSIYATGYYDLMHSGCYNNNQATPPNLSAGEKKALDWLGKMDTITLSRDSIRVPVIQGGSDTAYFVQIPGTQEFFTVEARRKTGWDAYIPSAGILIHHGNWSKLLNWFNNGYNIVNTNASDRGWFIESAVGTMNSYNEAQWAFVGTSNRNYFTRNSSNQISRANGTPINGITFTSMIKINDSLYMFNFNSETPMLETGNFANLTMNSFSSNGTIVYQGTQSITAKGIVYSTSEDCPFEEQYAVYDNNLTDTINIASLSITGLERGTTYYYRSFIKNNNGTHLGPIKVVTTVSGLGSVAIQSANNITETTATFRAMLSSVGSTQFIRKGFSYVTDENSSFNPDSTEHYVIVEGSDLGSFSANVTDLVSGQTYYVKAFVQNGYGYAYSNRTSFQTLAPEVTNNTITATTPEVCENTQPGQITGEEPQGGFGNFTYLWQRRDGSTWVDAEGTNNQQNYQPPVLTDSTYFRRVVYSNGLIGDVSNTVLIDVQISRGGVVNFAYETVFKNTQGTFTLTGKRGDVVAWEKSSDNFSTYQTINNTSTSYTETFDQAGEFSYRALVQIASCPSTYSQPKSVTVLSTSSLENVENSFVFSVMPNPSTNGNFVINSQINNAERVSIVNVLGQVVYQEQNVDLTNKTFSLPNVDNGSYIIRIEAEGKTAQQKIVINK
ncbi:MAG: M6 family metalloprotease domain-containing protein, partial [Bacteroidota bacterium]|nr:M6 family metalloprotease domain-containing protein [Bacteroidota bacterium]